MKSLLIAGDLVPTEHNKNIFSFGDIKTLLGEELLLIWNSTDLKIFNLEVPLVNNKSQIDKYGPNLIAPINSINGIKALNPTLITLANNHIMDQGIQGFNSTLNILNINNIPYVGIGKNLQEACKPYILQSDELKIGIYACAEHEFTIATINEPGANPFDPLESFDHITDLKIQCEKVIVIYHGGIEHYQYPSPYLQKVCRKMVEKGADIVVCQHSHCIGAYEIYNNSTIIYGQGNFIFNRFYNEYWQNSILIYINLEEKIKINYIPIVTTKKGIRLACDNERDEILNQLHKRSIKILDEDFIETSYKDFTRKNIDHYLRILLGFNKHISRLDRYIFKGKILKNILNKQHLLAIENIIKCESHRELLINGVTARRNNL